MGGESDAATSPVTPAVGAMDSGAEIVSLIGAALDTLLASLDIPSVQAALEQADSSDPESSAQLFSLKSNLVNVRIVIRTLLDVVSSYLFEYPFTDAPRDAKAPPCCPPVAVWRLVKKVLSMELFRDILLGYDLGKFPVPIPGAGSAGSGADSRGRAPTSSEDGGLFSHEDVWLSIQATALGITDKGGLLWSLVRILCHIIVESGLNGDDEAKDEGPYWYYALEALQALLQHGIECELSFVDREVYHALASLSTVLMGHRKDFCIAQSRVLKVLKFHSVLVMYCRGGLVQMLKEIQVGSTSTSLPSVHSNCHIQSYRRLVTEIQSALIPSTDEGVHMTDSELEIASVAAAVDISSWQELMAAVLEQSKFSHVTVNLHEQESFALKEVTPDMTTRLVTRGVAGGLVGSNYGEEACTKKVDETKAVCLTHMRSLFKVLGAEQEKRERDCAWMLKKLEYERGPWFGLKPRTEGDGKSSDPDINLSGNWCLDFTETDGRTRLLLQRSEYANRHRRASSIQQRKGHKSKEASPAEAGDNDNDTDTAFRKQIRKQIARFMAEPALLEEPDPEDEFGQDFGINGDKRPASSKELAAVTDSAESAAGKTLLDNMPKIFADDDQVVFTAPCEIVTVVTNSDYHALGTIEIQGKKLIYRRNEEDKFTNNCKENDEFLWALEQYGYAIIGPKSKHKHGPSEWDTQQLQHIMERTFQMRKVAVELFFSSRKSFMFAFEDKVTMRKFLRKLVGTRPRHLNPYYLGSPGPELVHRQHPKFGKSLQEAWLRRDISNFDYILELNRLAGRSFNDLSQYPVFPWVLKDYRSRELDLNDPGVYRDLRWPIGAQDPKVRDTLQANYEAAVEDIDGMIPVRHFGGHFSQPNSVHSFMIRMEPFTSLHVWFQGGKFDHADRLFRSVADTYANASGPNSMDVKELIPEFYCNPDFLQNPNNISLGTTQQGIPLGPVELPPWAINAHDFVSKMRQALESEYVSANLHHWIDLIFGNKSQPPSMRGGSLLAVDACNIYDEYHYPGAYNLEQMKKDDEALFVVTMKKILEFGTNPITLFPDAHPLRPQLIESSRESPEYLGNNIIWKIASSVDGYDERAWNLRDEHGSIPDKVRRKLKKDKPAFCQCYTDEQVSSLPILFIGEVESKKTLVTLDLNRILGSHPFEKRGRDTNPPHIFAVDKVLLRAMGGQAQRTNVSSIIKAGMGVIIDLDQKAIGVPFAVWGNKSGSWGGGSISSSTDSMLTSGAVLDSSGGGAGAAFGPANKSYVKRLEKGRSERGKKQRTPIERTLDRARETDQAGAGAGAAVVAAAGGAGVPRSPGTSVTSSVRKHRERDRESPTKGTRRKGRGGKEEKERSERARQERREEVSGRSRERDRQRAAAAAVAASKTAAGDGSPSKQQPQPQPQPQPQQARAGEGKHYTFGDAPARPKSSDLGGRHRGGGRDGGGYRAMKNPLPQHLSPHLFALLPQYRLFFSCGYYDSSLRVDSVETNRRVQTLRYHSEVVTCLSLASDLGQHWLVTGSKDCTLNVWEVNPDRPARPINPLPLATIRGHDDVINCVAVNPELNLIVSGSDDGTMMLHTLRDATYIRNIRFGDVPRDNSYPRARAQTGLASASARVNMVLISPTEALIIAYSCDCNKLHTYSLNSMDVAGPLKSIGTNERLHTMILSEDGKVIITGGTNCLVMLRWARTLMAADTGPREHLEAVVDGSSRALPGPDGTESEKPRFDSPIRSLYMTAMEQHLVVGLESGRIRILTQDNTYLKDRLHSQLLVTGYFDLTI